MEIRRHGASRFMGYASIHLRKPEITFDPKDGLIHIKSYNVGDFTAEASHNYDIMLSLDEINQLISAALKAVPVPAPST